MRDYCVKCRPGQLMFFLHTRDSLTFLSAIHSVFTGQGFVKPLILSAAVRVLWSHEFCQYQSWLWEAVSASFRMVLWSHRLHPHQSSSVSRKPGKLSTAVGGMWSQECCLPQSGVCEARNAVCHSRGYVKPGMLSTAVGGMWSQECCLPQSGVCEARNTVCHSRGYVKPGMLSATVGVMWSQECCLPQSGYVKPGMLSATVGVCEARNAVCHSRGYVKSGMLSATVGGMWSQQCCLSQSGLCEVRMLCVAVADTWSQSGLLKYRNSLFVSLLSNYNP